MIVYQGIRNFVPILIRRKKSELKDIIIMDNIIVGIKKEGKIFAISKIPRRIHLLLNHAILSFRENFFGFVITRSKLNTDEEGEGKN